MIRVTALQLWGAVTFLGDKLHTWKKLIIVFVVGLAIGLAASANNNSSHSIKSPKPNLYVSERKIGNRHYLTLKRQKLVKTISCNSVEIVESKCLK